MTEQAPQGFAADVDPPYGHDCAAGRHPGHPYTQGPAAIKDALAEIESWRLLAREDDDV